MAAAEEEEWGWTAGQLHHCQEGPICRNKGLHLSCQAQDLAQHLYLQSALHCARIPAGSTWCQPRPLSL